eukprot:GHVP01053514.1.p1 GENE.GHVP01053514.1~~GHVP01053514.1.p1  ORF type:complete len:410 (+),score=60.40 GHVP01053514.1:311-1540(+)
MKLWILQISWIFGSAVDHMWTSRMKVDSKFNMDVPEKECVKKNKLNPSYNEKLPNEWDRLSIERRLSMFTTGTEAMRLVSASKTAGSAKTNESTKKKKGKEKKEKKEEEEQDAFTFLTTKLNDSGETVSHMQAVATRLLLDHAQTRVVYMDEKDQLSLLSCDSYNPYDEGSHGFHGLSQRVQANLLRFKIETICENIKADMQISMYYRENDAKSILKDKSKSDRSAGELCIFLPKEPKIQILHYEIGEKSNDLNMEMSNLLTVRCRRDAPLRNYHKHWQHFLAFPSIHDIDRDISIHPNPRTHVIPIMFYIDQSVLQCLWHKTLYLYHNNQNTKSTPDYTPWMLFGQGLAQRLASVLVIENLTKEYVKTDTEEQGLKNFVIFMDPVGVVLVGSDNHVKNIVTNASRDGN